MEEKMHSSLYLTTLKKSIVLVNITSQTNKYNIQPWSIIYVMSITWKILQINIATPLIYLKHHVLVSARAVLKSEIV